MKNARALLLALVCGLAIAVVAIGQTNESKPDARTGKAPERGLAGQQCPYGQFVSGFTTTGALICGTPRYP